MTGLLFAVLSLVRGVIKPSLNVAPSMTAGNSTVSITVRPLTCALLKISGVSAFKCGSVRNRDIVSVSYRYPCVSCTIFSNKAGFALFKSFRNRVFDHVVQFRVSVLLCMR